MKWSILIVRFRIRKELEVESEVLIKYARRLPEGFVDFDEFIKGKPLDEFSAEMMEKVNLEYQRIASKYDAEDQQSWLAAGNIYAG